MNDAHPNPNDDRLLALIADGLATAQPIPTRVMEQAFQATQMRKVSDQLAELLFDSAVDEGLVLTRSNDPEGEARLLSFANDHLTLDCSLSNDGLGILGEIAPPGSDHLIVESDDTAGLTVAVDEYGRFRATVPPGPIRLRVPGQLVTPWIRR